MTPAERLMKSKKWNFMACSDADGLMDEMCALLSATPAENVCETGDHDDCTEMVVVEAVPTPSEPEREQLAAWMIAHSFATGHGDTFKDLLKELDWQVAELQRAQGRLSEEVRKLHVYTRSEIDKLDYSDGIGLLSQDHVYELRIGYQEGFNDGNERGYKIGWFAGMLGFPKDSYDVASLPISDFDPTPWIHRKAEMRYAVLSKNYDSILTNWNLEGTCQIRVGKHPKVYIENIIQSDPGFGPCYLIPLGKQ